MAEKKKVIVIDDEPFILMMIEDKFTRAGLEVITLRESVNAVEIIRRERPDLVILDWMMPEVSGIEVCQNLKSDPELSHIPVFMLTAKGQEEDERLGLKSGADRYITKPFSPKTLLEEVLERIGEIKGP
ncbi:MAG: response regulator [Nitrospirae bacterium]|nr:MAG: response regulator [Nitrospirota bacterium]